jgi:beta-lactamase regulating signal transducer with metallopeptidase domain
MNINLISIAWAFLQIAFLCSLSLVVAWSLRGRRPQLVTALLSGTCIASLLLAMVSVVPKFQWTLARDDTARITAATPVSRDGVSVHSHPPDVAANEDGNVSDARVQMEAEDVIAPAGAREFDALRTWISQSLRLVDREVRGAEAWQKPVSAVRNYSLLILVLTGLSAMSLLWCSSWLYMQRILRCSQRVEDQSILTFVASQARGFGLKRIPAVCESNLVSIGATVGWRRVTVLLHSDWREWSTEERAAVISHELAHAARHDFAWVIISCWTRILLFFHPMVHLLIHRLRLEQELAADQLAAGTVGNARAYGRALASLALRSQQGSRNSQVRFSPMLAAGQICVTRRVTMLRQGSLKPISFRSRWSIWAVSAIACSAIPIAGLRGITDEPIPKTKSVAESTTPIDSEEQLKPKPLSKEFLTTYPPVELKGAMVYRPGRFRAGEFGPEAAWFQEWFAVSMLGKPMPDQATVYGECKGIMRWTDEERKHGRFDLQAGFHEGESTSPGQLTKLVDPFTGRPQNMRTVSTQELDGRTISGVTNSTATDEPEKWLIDDEKGFFLGSHEQAVAFAHGQKFALDSIPENFREDYRNAAFGMVYDDCDQWYSKLEAHGKDAPNDEEFQILGFKPHLAVFKSLKQLGVFVDGCRTPACSIRAVMRDEGSAKWLATQMTMLLELGKVSVAAMPSDRDKLQKEASSSILETMQIAANGSEVLFQFDIFVPSLADGPMSGFRSTAGWVNINSTPKCETLGAVTVRPDFNLFSTPGLFGQTLDASEYRGKTVLLELAMQCNDDAGSQVGAFVWASRQEKQTLDAYSGRLPRQRGSPYVGHRVLAAKSIAANGSSAWSDAFNAKKRPEGNALLPDAPNRTLTIPFTVPNDAEHLSFGCYSKNSEIRVSNMKFQVVDGVGNQSVATGIVKDATEDVPYNVLVMPGYTIRKSPAELNFEQSVPKSVEVAERPASNEKR